MNNPQVAIYARVSCEQQVSTNTIESQLVALQEQVNRDGHACPTHRQFVDDGHSGSTLVRPALEQLRDAIAYGEIDRLYVQSPDRLARKYAYQVILVDEFTQAGVEVIFLNHALGQSPEDELLLQVQGMVAESERAKILERSRRGKRHAAQSGSRTCLFQGTVWLHLHLETSHRWTGANGHQSHDGSSRATDVSMVCP